MITPRIIGQTLLDELSAEAKASPRLRRNRNFHAAAGDASQRLLNAVEPGSYIPPHRHLDPNKDESILILRGVVGAVFFDESGIVTETALLRPGGAAVGLNVAHGIYHTVISFEEGTVFFESKAGPYVPLNPDERAAWAPAEGDASAREYLERLAAMLR